MEEQYQLSQVEGGYIQGRFYGDFIDLLYFFSEKVFCIQYYMFK